MNFEFLLRLFLDSILIALFILMLSMLYLLMQVYTSAYCEVVCTPPHQTGQVVLARIMLQLKTMISQSKQCLLKDF
nr:hypothetical protein Iba_chr02bCG10980 [Ipomoea batatas]